MKRLYITLLMMGTICTTYTKTPNKQQAAPTPDTQEKTVVTIVNGTNHELKVALATDYNQYNVPGMAGNYIGIETLGPHERSPWLTGWSWKTIKKGKTKNIELPAGSLCPEYLVFKPKCKLHSDRLTQFETYDAIKLVDDPKEAGKYGSYSCPGEAMVTISRRKKTDKTVKCEADVTVNSKLHPKKS